jgi:hypothetical protein
MKNRLYFHVYSCGSHVNSIVGEMISRIESSGLGENCDTLNFCVIGDEKFLDIEFPRNSKLHINKNPCEFDTLHLLWKECQEEDMNVCYVHTKGISKHDWICVDDWRNYLSYFTIDRWKDRIENLKEYDCTGVNFKGERASYLENPLKWGNGAHCPPHYSGNFWWSKSSHIRKLSDINKWPIDGDYEKWRLLCEMWLCQPENSRYHCAWESNVKHYGYRYTEENYIERK